MNKGAPAGTLSDAAMEALYQDIVTKLNVIYASGCVVDAKGKTDTKQNDNKNNDLDKMKQYAIAGQWTIDQFGNESVEYMANKIIANTQGLIDAGRILASCFGGAAELQALADEVYFLLNVFKNQGDYSTPDGQLTAVACEDDQSENAPPCEATGKGWKIFVPGGAFGQNVIIIIKPNDGNAPEGLDPVGKSWHFDVIPNIEAKSPGWTRSICWEGTNPGEDDLIPNPSWVVLVREGTDGLDYLETDYEGWGAPTCDEVPEELASSLLIKSAKRFFAGLPFFPTKLDAYSPPRTFGGTTEPASPHWLTVLEPVPPETEWTFDLLCEETRRVLPEAPNTADAACTHLENAETKFENGDIAGGNRSLDQYIQVIGAQVGKSITLEQANYLAGIAESLKQ
jgi:hypothetical protein